MNLTPIEAFEARMVALGRSKHTIRRRTMTTARFAEYLGGETALFDARPPDVDRFICGLAVKPQSRNYYLGDLAAFYRWAIQVELTETDPTVSLDRPKRVSYQPKPIGDDELRFALGKATDDQRLTRMLLLAALGGLRAGEIAGLHTDDVDFVYGLIRVRGKGDKTRLVPLHPRLREVLDGLEGWVAPSEIEPDEHVSAEAVTQYVGKFLRGLGMERTCHTLRHWFATGTYRAVRDLRAVQTLLGHASPNTTAGYVAHDPQVERQAVEALDI